VLRIKKISKKKEQEKASSSSQDLGYFRWRLFVQTSAAAKIVHEKNEG